MRMWMINPKYMCIRHRAGEHGEIHKHLPTLYKAVSVHGRFNPIVQIQLNALQSRHDKLALILNHNSPLDIDDYLIWKNYPQYYDLNVDIDHNIKDLSARCPECCKLLKQRR